jgi:predicted nucleic acid-binding protein
MNARIVIVDTNRLFSSVLPGGKSDRAILQRSEYRFFTPNFTIIELFKRRDALLKKAKSPEASVLGFLEEAIECVNFVSVSDISVGTFLEAYRICRATDRNDTAFIALTLHLDGVLWTRDDTLKVGLTKQGFTRLFSV